jgi:hypothetical protein
MAINRITQLQTEIAHLYMRRRNLTPAQFLKEDEKYGILRFLESGYEPFHVTGEEGVLSELEKFIEDKKALSQSL